MAVYGANGQIIGTVIEVAGFGSTCIGSASGSTGAQVTQARSGTGYLKVERPGKDDLYVPFHGIEAVIPGRGVNLTAAALDELRASADAHARQVDEAHQSQASGANVSRRLWRSRPWALRRAHKCSRGGNFEGGKS